MTLPCVLWQDAPTLHSVRTPSHMIEDDDDIDWKYNLFDVDLIYEADETPQQLLSQITFDGYPQLQKRLKALVLEFIDVFATKVRREPAAVEHD